MVNLIQAKNVTKHYKMGEVTVKALNGVSMKVEKGDFIIIVGPSGSGKSTLMHILGALDRPTSGEVFIEGKNISHLDDWSLAMIRRKKIGFVFQTFNLIPTLNALENVMIPLEPTGTETNEAIPRARELLKLMDIEDRALHKPSELSGGERQRVSIARALVNDPDVVLADEPTGNLDTVTGQKVIEAMLHLNEEKGKTFVTVTHDTDLIKYATQEVHIRDGLIKVKKGKNHRKGK